MAAVWTLDVLSGEIVREQQRFSTTVAGLGRLGSWLRDHGVVTVAMEATGVYWKPVFYALEGRFEEVWVCNAAHVKNVPGRKTDLSDAMWLADVVAHGMVKASFVPPPSSRAAARPVPLPQGAGRCPDPGDPTLGQGAAGRLRQVDVGGFDGVVEVVAGDDRSVDRR